MNPIRRDTAAACILLLLWGLLLGSPLLVKGFPVDGHDFWAHTTWGGHFARQFWNGDLYPRWLLDHNEGLGSPTFFFYPPLPFWLTALLSPMFPAETAPVSALAWVATIMLVLSGWFTFFWLRELVPARSAAFAAALYQVAPYHLLIDLYQRAAFAEFCAMTWLPLVLLAARRVGRARRRSAALLAFGTALLTATHMLSVMMIGPIALAYSVVSAVVGRRLRAALTAIAAMTLGLALSGAYLVPALRLQRHVNLEALWQGWGHYRQHLYDWKLVVAAESHVFHLLLLASLVSSAVLAALFYWSASRSGGVATPVRDARPTSAWEAHFWFAVVVITSFMFTRLSDPVWQLLTPLQKLQFPWRLATVLSVALSPLAALAAARVGPGMRLQDRLPVLAAVVIVSLWLVVSALGGRDIMRQSPKPELNELAQDAWEYKPRWVLAHDFQLAVRSAKGPDGRIPRAVLGANGRIDVVRWRPRDIVLQVDASDDAVLTVHQFYFRGWRASLDGNPITVKPSEPHGFVTVAVPAGSHSVALRLRMTAPERIGWLLTALSAAICLGLLLPNGGSSRRASADSPAGSRAVGDEVGSEESTSQEWKR